MMLKHLPTNQIGVFVERKETFQGEKTIIRLPDGRRYFAPSAEFEKIGLNGWDNWIYKIDEKELERMSEIDCNWENNFRRQYLQDPNLKK